MYDNSDYGGQVCTPNHKRVQYGSFLKIYLSSTSRPELVFFCCSQIYSRNNKARAVRLWSASLFLFKTLQTAVKVRRITSSLTLPRGQKVAALSSCRQQKKHHKSGSLGKGQVTTSLFVQGFQGPSVAPAKRKKDRRKQHWRNHFRLISLYLQDSSWQKIYLLIHKSEILVQYWVTC